MAEKEIPFQKFDNLVNDYHLRKINRHELFRELPNTFSGMQPVELDAALHSLFEDPRYADIHADVAEIVAKHAGPELINTITAWYEQTTNPNILGSATKALIRYGEPAAQTLLKTLQTKGEGEQLFDRKLSTVRALKDAPLNAFTEESQAALLRQLAHLSFGRGENDIVKAQAIETLRDITAAGNVHLMAAAEVLSELTKKMPKTPSEYSKAFGSDKIMPVYFRHALSTLVEDATKGAVLARKEDRKPLGRMEKAEAALERFNKQEGIEAGGPAQRPPAPQKTAEQRAEELEWNEDKIEASLHRLFNQTAFPDLQHMGIKGLGDLRRSSHKTMKTLLDLSEDPRNKYLAVDALIKHAPAIGQSPKFLEFASSKFVENTLKEPFLAAYYGTLLAQAGPTGQDELFRIMSAHENEQVARHAAQWLAHTDKGVTKLSGIASLPIYSPQIRARAAYGLGATPPIITSKRNAHITLLDRLASSEKEPLEVRYAAMEGLLHTGEKGIAKVREMIDREPTPAGKLSIAAWLTKAPAGLNVLAELLNHKNPTTRAAAAFAVAESPTTLASILPKEKKEGKMFKVVAHPLYNALKKRMADPKETEEVKLAAKTALKKIREVRRNKNYAALFARTSSMLPPEPTPVAEQFRRTKMLPTLVGVARTTPSKPPTGRRKTK